MSVEKTNPEGVEVMDVVEVVDLEPITIGEVTEVTGAGGINVPDGGVIWGS